MFLLKNALLLLALLFPLKNLFAESEKKINNQSNTTFSDFIPKLQSENGDYSLKLKGRLMVDVGQELESDASHLDNEIMLRRSRIEVFGKLGKNFSYLNSYNINHKNTEVVDAYLTFEGIKNLKITAGHLVANTNMEGKTSSLTNPFIERSISYSPFTKHRRVGLLFNYFKQDWAIKVGAFGSELSKNQMSDKSRLINSRFYFLPMSNLDNSHYLHLGINASYQKIESFDKSLTFKSQTPSVIEKTIANTGSIENIESYKQYVPEFRYQNGPFSANLEYYKSYLERKNLGNLTFSGGYISSSYFLTKSSYDYGIEDGTPESVINSKNAIEIVTRYSYLDLNDKGVTGGKLKSYDLGVNYYLNDNFRVMLSYIANKSKDAPSISDRNSQLLIMRLQANF